MTVETYSDAPVTVEEIVAEFAGSDVPQAVVMLMTRDDLEPAEIRARMAQLKAAETLRKALTDTRVEIEVAREKAFRQMDRANQTLGIAGLEKLAKEFPGYSGITDTLEMARRIYAEGA